MSAPPHPLLVLVDASKYDLKVSLTSYIDFTVEKQFGQLRNRIVAMIEAGEFANNLGDVNAPLSTQPNEHLSTEQITSLPTPRTNTTQVNSTYTEDSGDVVDRESHQIDPQHTEVSVSASVQPSTSNHQTEPSVAPSTMKNSNEHLSTDQIASTPVPSTITTEPVIKQEYAEIYGDNNAAAPNGEFDDVKEEYDDDDDDDEDKGEYMSDCDECEDCVKGICQVDQSRLVGENDNANKDGNTGVDTESGLNREEIEDEPNVASGLSVKNIPDVIDGSNQSAQPVIEHNQQSMPSSSGLSRSHKRKQIPKNVVADDDQSNGEGKSDKRKSTAQSSEAVKKVKHQDVGQMHREEEGEDNDHEVEEETKLQIVTLEVNCTEPDCGTILNTFEMWKKHLSSIHGQMPYNHLENKARLNQHGQTEYACTECNTINKSQVNLNVHWKNYHQAGKFECSVCAFVANFRGEVKNHQKKIHRTKKIQCTHQGCNKAFKCNYDLEHHKRIHSRAERSPFTQRPFKCTWDNCGYSTGTRPNVIKHIRTQHFGLPETLKEQGRLNIVDNRDPAQFVQVDAQLAQPRRLE